MIYRWTWAIIFSLLFSGCSVTTKYASNHAPKSEWDDVSDVDVYEKSDKEIEGFVLIRDYGSKDYFYFVNGFVDSKTGEPIPDNSVPGLLLLENPMEVPNELVFLPIKYVEKWHLEDVNNTGPRKWEVETNLKSERKPLLSGKGLRLRYLDPNENSLNEAKLSINRVAVRLKSRESEKTNGVDDDVKEEPILSSKPLMHNAEKATLSDGVELIERYKVEYSRYKEEKEKKRKKEYEKNKRNREIRKENFDKLKSKEVKVGSYLCSKYNLITAVEKVGEERVKVSIIGKAKFNHPYGLFGLDFERFEMDTSDKGMLQWVNKEDFSNCDFLEIEL